MSDVVPAEVVPGSGTLALPDDPMAGLEDFDTSDMVMPRLQINHKTATLKDSLSGQEYPELDVVMLGLIKNRILWADEVEDGDRPLCKSHDFQHGNPDLLRFPWKESGFNQADADQDNPVLPCEGCALKEWGTAPNGKTPWCSEQHVFAVLMEVNGGFAPALYTVQRTGIKPSKTYLTSFVRTKQPTYMVYTKLGLRAERRGTVEYAVPTFTQLGETDKTDWPFFALQYRTIRDIVTNPPKRDDDDAPSSTPVTAPAAAPATGTASAAPVNPPADDDELPF
jgi:hypothetical protein